MEKMSLKDKLAIGVQAIEADKQGNHAEYHRLMATIPMEPGLAMNVKTIFGAEALRKGGWNLEEANAEYGHGWLDK